MKEEEKEEEIFEEEEEDEEDEEDYEPQLKYQRLGSHVAEILKKDAASCIAVHDKFLALGTHYGVICILDFNGNEIMRFPSHSATINELSIDPSGEFVASCSDDGKVCINGLLSENDQLVYEYHRPVISVSLDPLYGKKKTKSFAFGGKGGQLIINSKGFFARKDTILHSGEGPIYAIQWRGSLIAWANDNGVKIYDCEKGQRITHIERPKGSPRPDLYRCHLCWENDTTLLIGWANSIKIGNIQERPSNSGPLPDRFVVLTAIFQTDYFISGIAPFGEDLVVLAYIEDEEDQTNKSGKVMSANRPELRIITRTNEEITSDALTIQNYEKYQANDYRLGHMSSGIKR